MNEYFHYCTSMGFDTYRKYKQEHRANGKPKGLWISVGDAWEEWCRAESFGIHRLSRRYQIMIAHDARILELSTLEQVVQFNEQYNRKDSYNLDHIDWSIVAGEFQGIIISPYRWECRLTMLWYYGWDCASGCIWDLNAVGSVILK